MDIPSPDPAWSRLDAWLEELSSLLDLTLAEPGLPGGHPFELGGFLPFFWSASVSDADALHAYLVTFVREQPSAVPGARVYPKDYIVRAWCVRGGQGGHP